MPGIKDIMKAFSVLKQVPEADLERIEAEISKASPGPAEGLRPDELVHDFRTEGQVDKAPTRQEIRTGPSQSASGAGAEKMIAEYSHPSAQHGVVLTAEHFEKLMAPVASSMKALADHMKAMHDASVAAKAEPEDEEEDEVVEVNAKTCKALITKARALIAAAKAMEDEAEDEEDEKMARKGRREARALRKSAARVLARARTRAFAAQAKGKDFRVEIRTLIAKADIDVVEDEEEDDEDEAEKAKAAKARADMAANQADRANKDGNQDDAAKAQTITDTVKKALDDAGIPMVAKTVQELIETIMGQSRTQPPAVAGLAKGKPDLVLAKAALLPAAVEAGRLSPSDAMHVQELLNMQKNATAGHLDQAFVKARMDRAPQPVRDFLAADAA